MFRNRSLLVKIVKDDPSGGDAVQVDVLDEVKNHFERNKATYLTLGIAGITLLIMKGRIETLAYGGVSDRSIVGNAALDRINIRPFLFFSKQTINVVSVIEREGRGHPGYLVRCLETNQTFPTQGEAARHFASDATTMSRHIVGILPNVKGFHFERLAA